MGNGGVCIGYSNAHYGHPRNIILPGTPIDMSNGWETARRLDRPEILTADSNGVLNAPGCEWAAFRLGVKGTVSRIEIDTAHYKGNFPDSIKIEACCVDSVDAESHSQSGLWKALLPSQKVS
jgi:allantoicase